MEITQYTGIEVVNLNPDVSNGKVGYFSGFLDGEFKKDEYYTLQFKIIDMLNMPLLNWMYITYSDGTEQKLQDVNLNNFETVGTLSGKVEKLCYFNFKANGSGVGRLIIARRQTVVDIASSTAYYLREVDIKPGKILTDFTLSSREQAFETIKLYSSIQSIAGEINMKVGRNDIISSINLSPEQIKLDSKKILLRAENVMVAWNNINDSIQLRSDELAMYGAGTGSGKRLSLKRGLLNTYRDTDNGFLGYYGMDRTYEKYYGTTNLGSYYSWFFGIAQDLTMNHDTNMSTDKKYYVYVSFADHESYPKGTHVVEAPLYVWKSIQMKGNNVYDIGNLYFDDINWSRISRMSNRGLLLEGDPELQIGIRNDGKFDTYLQMLHSYPYDIFSYKHLDMQGRSIKNAVLTASYPITNNPTIKTVGADSLSVEGMLLEEDYAEYDEENNAVIVNMNEAMKSVYSRNKYLENENAILKSEDEKIKEENNKLKTVVDEMQDTINDLLFGSMTINK